MAKSQAGLFFDLFVSELEGCAFHVDLSEGRRLSRIHR